MKLRLLTIVTLFAFHQTLLANEVLVFECKRVEKDFIEEYEMKLVPASKSAKAKVFLDGRDLDRSDGSGTQAVKAIRFAPPNIVILIDAQFEPELLSGVSYPAGTVSTLITLNQTTGKLKKVETIQGGILGSHLGNGTQASEEACLPAKAN
ncbi:hypothetical protein [Polynucleobacter necessarius]|uniref:hypothetical protein n=1 Tax=Polynucleobacter necessarius TaxID=576610 RepID=UPI001E362A9B|nr:hypothetical protein [Polynucleobacter necessarius]